MCIGAESKQPTLDEKRAAQLAELRASLHTSVDKFIAYLAGQHRPNQGHIVDCMLGRCVKCGALQTTIDDGMAGDCPK